ncbi:MAG: exodeoxyribonuclease VII large subunit [Congregibacter sp.]
MTPKPEALTPSQLNREVRSLLESHFDFVWIEGELSNFARPSSGHWYFSLKDDSAQVRCAMFRNKNQRLRFQPKDGDQLRLRARVSLYEGRGEFQLIGEFMEPAGAGALQARFEELRDRLSAEGLFDADRKRALPSAVRHLALITSPTGAALQDILQVLERRNPSIIITVLPVQVQGEGAAEQLEAAVLKANQLHSSRADCDFDAIILARGGGSIEDLWAFNDEALARAIRGSELPLVTGVGHEVDVSIADFAADMRAPTPSAAAELLSDDSAELLERLRVDQRRLKTAMERQLERLTMRLDNLNARLRHPGDRLREQTQRLDELDMRLRRGMQLQLSHSRDRILRFSERLQHLSPERRLALAQEQLARSGNTLVAAMQQQLNRHREQLNGKKALLKGLNPLAVLSRGYAVITNEAGTIIRDSGQLQSGQIVNARLAHGSVNAKVLEPQQADPAKLQENGS